MSWLVTSSQRASQQNNRGLCLVFQGFLAAQRERERVHTDWCIHLAFSLISVSIHIFKCFCVSFCKEENILICSASLYYCLEWKQFVSSCRISTDLAARFKSLTLSTKMPVPIGPVFFFSFFLLPCLLYLFCPSSFAYSSICPFTGLREKGLHEQDLRHSGRVHQRAECSGWSGLLWREDKKVSCKPALRQLARSMHIPSFFFSCLVSFL